jgi:Tfp pilus assembly protein PilN
MRPVNLLPKDTAGTRRSLPSLPVVAAGTTPVLAAALVLFGWSTAHAKARDRGAELDAVQARVRAVQPSRTADAAAGLAALRDARAAAADDVLAQRVPWDSVLDQVARVLPGDVWLTSMSLQTATPLAGASTATASPGLQLNGLARSQAAVAHALARLSVVPALTGVTLLSTTTSDAGKTATVQFQITATVGASS